MTQFAYFRLEHSSFNRKDWGYGRVAAHARYGANQNKIGAVATVGIPICRTSYDTEREFMKLEKLTTRKNGRTGDTIIVSLPKEVEPEHRVLMMERFLSKVTYEGRTYAQAWEHIDKPDNPHFHVAVVDRDRVTGESVGKFGHSRSWRKKNGLEPNVTEWMRQHWEDTGNELFSELGYNLKFDRRNYLERGVEPPGVHRGPMPANQNVEYVAPQQQDLPLGNPAVEVSKPIQADTPVEPSPQLDKPEGMEKLAPTPSDVEPLGSEDAPAKERNEWIYAEKPVPKSEVERPDEADISDAGHHVRTVYSYGAELDYINEQRENLKHTLERIDALQKRRDGLYDTKGKHFEEMVRHQGKALGAKAHLSKFQKANGKFKGISIRLLGRNYATEKRLKAEAAAREAHAREWDAKLANDQQKEYEREIARLSTLLESAYADADAIKNSMPGPAGDELTLARHEGKLRRDIEHLINGDAHTIPPSRTEIWQAWEAGDVTDDELRAYCRHADDKVMLAELEHELSQTQSHEL